MNKNVIVSRQQIIDTIKHCSFSGFNLLAKIIVSKNIEPEDLEFIISAWKEKLSTLEESQYFKDLNEAKRAEFDVCFETLKILENKRGGV